MPYRLFPFSGLFLKILLLLLILNSGLVSGVFAVKYVSLYTTGCQRITGILTHVQKRQVDILKLDGTIEKVNTFDVRFASEYTYEVLLIDEIKNGEGLNYYEIYTLENKTEVLLAKGWLSGGDDRSFALINPEGREVLVDVGDITRISKVPFPASWQNNKTRQPIKFTHYYLFGECPYPENQRDAKPIYPGKLLTDRFELKKYFDGFKAVQDRMEFLINEQKFYAKPFYFKSENKLGMWYNLNSRHVSHGKRLNKLLPTYINGYSTLPFDYQHVIVGGPGLLDFTPYTAPQNQFFYHMRSGYFGLYILYDIDVLLLGNDYDPGLPDFSSKSDDQITEMASFNMYFGYGTMKIGIGESMSKYYVKVDDRLFKVDPDNGTNARYGINYEDYVHKADLFYSPISHRYKSSSAEIFKRTQSQSTQEVQAYINSLPEYGYKGYYARTNYTYFHNLWSIGVSVINRKIKFDFAQNLIEINAVNPENPPVVYESDSWILGLFYNHRFNPVLSLKVQVSGETMVNDYGYSEFGYTVENGKSQKIDSRRSHLYFDTGVGIFLNF